MFHDIHKYGNNNEMQFKNFLFSLFNLGWDKIKIDLQHGNHHPISLKSIINN